MARTVGFSVAPPAFEAQVFVPGERRAPEVKEGSPVAGERMWWSSGPSAGTLAYPAGVTYPAEHHAMLAPETEWLAHLRGSGAITDESIGNEHQPPIVVKSKSRPSSEQRR